MGSGGCGGVNAVRLPNWRHSRLSIFQRPAPWSAASESFLPRQAAFLCSSPFHRAPVLGDHRIYESVRILPCRRRPEQNRTNIDFFAVLQPDNHGLDEVSDILHGRKLADHFATNWAM